MHQNNNSNIEIAKYLGKRSHAKNNKSLKIENKYFLAGAPDQMYLFYLMKDQFIISSKTNR
jgi:hypothetical protein